MAKYKCNSCDKDVMYKSRGFWFFMLLLGCYFDIETIQHNLIKNIVIHLKL